jgi:RNA polymerase sigma factor (sigma-70 family)
MQLLPFLLFGWVFDRIGSVLEAPRHTNPAERAGWFTTTHWTVILDAKSQNTAQAAEGLNRLCETYWAPVYAYVRRMGHSPADSEDLTQQFFARFLEKEIYRRAERERGKFRSFLLTSLKNFLAHDWERAKAAKRGGDQTAVSLDAASAENGCQFGISSDLTPDKAFEKRWALTLFQKALTRLREESVAGEKKELFERLKNFLTEQPADGAYADVAATLNMTTGAVAMAVHRLRQRYAEIVREEIAHTVASPADVQDELHYLIELVAS